MGNQIYYKIAGYVNLAVLIIFNPCQILILLTVFELFPKPAILPYVLFLVTAAMLVGARPHRTPV
jgi:hypothetical protein